jgi:hypothetical protein
MKLYIYTFIFLVITNFSFSQTTRYVNSAIGNDANAGTLAAPYKTFHRAYTVAVSGDIINLTGTFDWTATDETGDASGSGYTISKNITITGQSASSTIIRATSSANTADRRIFTISNGISLTLNHLSILNGKTSNGGALYLSNSSSTLTLNNCEITNNNSTNNFGGAIYANYGLVTANNSTFSGNNVSTWGAVLYSYYGIFTFTNCTITSNTGGSILHTIFGSGNINLTNNTIAFNSISFSYSNAVWIETSGYTLNFQNNLIVENKNSTTPKDIVLGGSTMNNVKNNIIQTTGTGINNGTNGNIVGNNTFGLDNTLSLNGSSNTKTLAINCFSIAVNAGINNSNGSISVPTTDQRGTSRVGNPDIGSFENNGSSEISTTGSLIAFAKCGSSPSSNQTIVVSGCNLTNNISITAPTGFEISTNASTGFGSSLSLTQSGGSVASTTIFIRMTAASTGSPSGNISLTSTGATNIDRAVSGTAASLSTGTASANQVVCHNTNATDITLSGSSGTIQWERSADNSTWTNISAATSATLTAAQIGAVTSTSFIRAQVTSGSCSGISNTVTLEVNNALDFDGIDDRVSLGTNSVLNFTSNFTIESWVFVPSSPKSNINTIFAKNVPNHGTPGYNFGFNHWNTSNLLLVLDDGSSAISSNKPVTAGAWNHVAIVVSNNGTLGTFYINGSPAGGGNVVLTNGSDVSEIIGAMDGSGNYSLRGALDELRIWNTARTQQEIIDNMDNPLTGSESGLVAYYDFDQGIPGGPNTSITSVLNKTANSLNGTFTGISRSGTTSNFVDGNHAVIVSSDYGCINGNSAKLIVGATGKVPLSIQWYKNTTNSTSGATLLTGSTSQVFNTDANESSTKFYYATIAGTCAASSNSNIISLQNPVVTGTIDVYEDNTTQLACSDAAAASSPWVSLNTSLLTISNTGLATGVYPGLGRVIYTTNAGCKDTVNVNVHETEWTGNNSNEFLIGSNWKLNSKPTILKKIRFNSNAANNLILNSRTTVDSIDFGTSTKQIELGDNDLIVNNIKNFNSSRYIKTIGAGKVKKQLSNNASFTFPVGNKAYNPITITNKTGTADTFSVNILDTAFLNGASSGIINNPYVKRTWNVSKNTASANAGSGVDLTFTWNANEVVGTLTNPTLNHHNGSGWEIPTMGIPSVSGTTLTYTGYKGAFSPFVIGGSSSVGLEVELMNFDAICKSDYIQVDWTTASEINNKVFELYKSVDAKSWNLIYTASGQGNKAAETRYSFNDMDKNAVYYRLKDIDFNGIENWSPIISVDCESNTTKTEIYPNPTTDYIKVSTEIDEKTTLQILSIDGRILKSLPLISKQTLIDLKDLTSGLYFIEIHNKQKIENIKIYKY